MCAKCETPSLARRLVGFRTLRDGAERVSEYHFIRADGSALIQRQWKGGKVQDLHLAAGQWELTEVGDGPNCGRVVVKRTEVPHA